MGQNSKELVRISDEIILHKIFEIRGYKVILDKDIAQMYQIENKYLKRQVRRNIERFPDDFMFELTTSEADQVVCHFDTPSKSIFGGANPMVFTQEGVAMLSSVLRSEKAVQVNIAIMRAFIRIRKIAENYSEVLELLKKYDKKFKEYDESFIDVYKKVDLFFDDIGKKKIGFSIPND
jgi:hypothetical protein